MFLQKAVLWPDACVIGRYRVTENNKGTDGIAYEYVPAKSRRQRSPLSDRRSFRICKTASDDGLEKWRVSQSFWRVFVERKTRISDRMTKIIWPWESKFIRYEGLSISDGWQQRLSETFFDRFLMRKTWTLRLRKECRQRVWLMIHRVETQRTAW